MCKCEGTFSILSAKNMREYTRTTIDYQMKTSNTCGGLIVRHLTGIGLLALEVATIGLGTLQLLVEIAIKIVLYVVKVIFTALALCKINFAESLKNRVDTIINTQFLVLDTAEIVLKTAGVALFSSVLAWLCPVTNHAWHRKFDREIKAYESSQDFSSKNEKRDVAPKASSLNANGTGASSEAPSSAAPSSAAAGAAAAVAAAPSSAAKGVDTTNGTYATGAAPAGYAKRDSVERAI